MKRLAALALVGAAFAARAATTNEVDVAALLAVADNNATTTTNGWTLCSIGTYVDSSLQFNANADSLLSPDYGAGIIGVVAKVRHSETVTRWLSVVNEANGKELARFATCAKKDSLEEQQPVFDSSAGASRIRFKFGEGGTGSTGWGIGDLKVVLDFDAPLNICVSRKGGDWCGLSWVNGECTVSNRIDTTLVERSDEGETVLLSTGFDSFSAGGNPEPKTNELAKIDAALSGLRIYSPANTTGVCQVATGTASGYLRHSGFADYSGISLKIVLKRYPGDNGVTQIAYETDGGIIVPVDKIMLPQEFEERIVDLGDVPCGAAILIGYDTVASNRRVLIDSLEFVRGGAETKTVVDSRWIPATPGATSFSTKDYGIELSPKSEYRFEVRSKTAGVLVSDPTAVDVVLDSPPGIRFILR